MISVGHHILSPFRERTGRPEPAGLRRSNDCSLKGMIRGIENRAAEPLRKVSCSRGYQQQV